MVIKIIQKNVFFIEFQRLFIVYMRNVAIFFYFLFGIPVPWVLFFSSISISIYILKIPPLTPVVFYSSCLICHQIYVNFSKRYLKFKLPKFLEYFALAWWVISWIFLNS